MKNNKKEDRLSGLDTSFTIRLIIKHGKFLKMLVKCIKGGGDVINVKIKIPLSS